MSVEGSGSTGRARRAHAGDLDRCATVLGAAFIDDPWIRWCVDHHDLVGRVTELQRIALRVIGLRYGLVWVAEADEGIVSVAAWSDSAIPVDRSVFVELADRSRPHHGRRLAAAVDAESGGHPRPEADHLFLETVGTHPEHRRRGHGTAALQPGLALADRRGLVCGLETSTEANVAFYRGLGFEIVDHRVVEGGGPDVWAMHRPPHAESSRHTSRTHDM